MAENPLWISLDAVDDNADTIVKQSGRRMEERTGSGIPAAMAEAKKVTSLSLSLFFFVNLT